MKIRHPWVWRAGIVLLIAAMLSQVFGANEKILAAGSALGFLLILLSRATSRDEGQPPPRV